MTKERFKFLDATLTLDKDTISFNQSLIQKFNTITQRNSVPKSIPVESITDVYIQDQTVLEKAALVIKHTRGTAEIRFNKGAANRMTSLLGFDGEGKAEELVNRLSDKEDKDSQNKIEYKDLDYTPRGSYVTPERIEKLSEVLDDDERVHYLVRGSNIDVQGSQAGHSIFGDDRSRKVGTKGYIRTAFTQKRVVVKVPQWLGSDERSLPYHNITSVDLDTGLMNKRISLQTPGQTYHIEAQEPGKKEVRKLIRFIRDKINETQKETPPASRERFTRQARKIERTS